jgi:sulfatase maturation enzyme AslB (radical SAM superfamily)
VGKINEQVRSGTKWSDVLEFLNYCREYEFDFEFNTVLHYNNVFDLENLIKFIGPFNKDWYINILTHPDRLSIRHHDKNKLERFLCSIEQYHYPNKTFVWEFLRNSM